MKAKKVANDNVLNEPAGHCYGKSFPFIKKKCCNGNTGQDQIRLDQSMKKHWSK